MTSLYNLFQNISKLIVAESLSNLNFKESLLYPPSDYNMNENSLFLDIGSGFGKPVFHSALQVGCESKGIEVVPARVEFCIDFFYEFLNEKNFFGDFKFNPNNANYLGNSKNTDNNDLTDQNNLNTNIDELIDIPRINMKIPNELNNYVDTNCIKNNEDNISLMSNIDNNKEPKITNSDSISLESNVNINFERIINLNELNGNHYTDIIKDNSKSNLFLELRFNQDVIYDDSFIQILHENNKIYKSILIEDIFNSTSDDFDLNKFPILNYGKFFKLENISVAITAIDDYIYSNLEKIIMNTIFVDYEEREIVKNLALGEIHHFRKFSEIAEKIENIHVLDFILFINSIFNGKKSQSDLKKFVQNTKNKCDTILKYTGNQKTLTLFSKTGNKMNSRPFHKKKDLYDELKEQLMEKEKLFKENTTNNLDNNDASSECVEDTNLLKQVLVDIKLNSYKDNWYKLTSFAALDATKVNNYSNDKKKHYTHIYAYNKLMSKECRSKIAKILNKTKFKVLAWYSNPKQTKKAGLKNFTFLSKFPMQSTSTEKFHVYVYIKTK